jgi:hypothetical protein
MSQLLTYPKFRASDALGVPLNGGKVYFYINGTNTPKDTYSNSTLTIANSNPVILDTNGEATIYLSGGYKVVLYNSADVLQWTMDNLFGTEGNSGYYAGSTELDQGVTGSGSSIKALVDIIGSNTAKIILTNPPTSVSTAYTLSTTLTIPSNITLEVERGAIITKGSGNPTLTISGTMVAGAHQVFSGFSAGKVLFSANRIPPEWWYASGPYDTAWGCAVNAFASGPGMVIGLNKTYPLVTGFTVSNHRVKLEGCGKQSSIFSFTPTSTATAITFQRPTAEAIVQCGIRGFGFLGYGDFVKTAISLVDTDIFELDDVAVNTWMDSTYSSFGIKLSGRDFIHIRNCDINADTPINIKDNPNSLVDIDHSQILGCYLTASSTNANVLIDTGVNLTNLKIQDTGLALGSYGVKWIDTTSIIASNNFQIENVRWEQSTDASGYFVYIDHHTNLWNLQINDGYSSVTPKGIYLRNCRYFKLDGYEYVGTNTVLDIDATVYPATFVNTFFWPTATVSTGGLTKVFSLGVSYGKVSVLEVYDIPATSSPITMGYLPVFANNTLAGGSLPVGSLYRTNGDPDTICIVH